MVFGSIHFQCLCLHFPSICLFLICSYPTWYAATATVEFSFVSLLKQTISSANIWIPEIPSDTLKGVRSTKQKCKEQKKTFLFYWCVFVCSCVGGFVLGVCYIPLPWRHSREESRPQAKCLSASRCRQTPQTRWAHRSVSRLMETEEWMGRLLNGCFSVTESESLLTVNSNHTKLCSAKLLQRRRLLKLQKLL